MSKIVLPDIYSGFNLSTLNENLDKMSDALNDKVLYRKNPDGEANQMENLLDMNSNRIINLPAPASDLEPLRRKDITAYAGDVTGAAITAAIAAESYKEQAAVSAAQASASATAAYDNSRLTVGTVTTLDPGEAATVDINGVPGAQVIDFGIPRGEDGSGSGGSAPTVITTYPDFVVDSFTPADKYLIHSSPAGGWNTGPGTCTLEFHMTVNNYFAVNPNGHFAVVNRCDTDLSSTNVSGQGVIFGNMVGIGGTEGAPFVRASQIETWEYPDNPNNRWVFPDTSGGPGNQMVDGGIYRFLIETTISQERLRYIRYRRYIWFPARACWNLEVDSGSILDHNDVSNLTKTGFVFGHVFGSGASGWSLNFRHVRSIWGPPVVTSDHRQNMLKGGGTFYGPVTYSGASIRLDAAGANPALWAKVLPAADNDDCKLVVAPSKSSGQSIILSTNGNGASFGYAVMSALPTHAVISTGGWGGASTPELRIGHGALEQLKFNSNGVFVGTHPSPLGNDTTIFANLVGAGGANAKAFANSGSGFDIELLSTIGSIAGALTGPFTAPQATHLEFVLRPLYALLSTHIATTRNKGTA